MTTVLITDAAGAMPGQQNDHVLPVERGRADALSLHTATFALINALLIGIAAKYPTETAASLQKLNTLRAKITGRRMLLLTTSKIAQGKTRR